MKFKKLSYLSVIGPIVSMAIPTLGATQRLRQESVPSTLEGDMAESSNDGDTFLEKEQTDPARRLDCISSLGNCGGNGERGCTLAEQGANGQIGPCKNDRLYEKLGCSGNCCGSLGMCHRRPGLWENCDSIAKPCMPDQNLACRLANPDLANLTSKCSPGTGIFSSYNHPNQNDHLKCSNFFDKKSVKRAINQQSTTGFSVGSELALYATGTLEFGTASGLDGCTACFRTTCIGTSFSVGLAAQYSEIVWSQSQMECPGDMKCEDDPTLACQNDSDCGSGTCTPCYDFAGRDMVIEVGGEFGIGLTGAHEFDPDDVDFLDPVSSVVTLSGGVSFGVDGSMPAACQTKAIMGGCFRTIQSRNGKFLCGRNSNNDAVLRIESSDLCEWIVIHLTGNKYAIRNAETNSYLVRSNGNVSVRDRNNLDEDDKWVIQAGPNNVHNEYLIRDFDRTMYLVPSSDGSDGSDVALDDSPVGVEKFIETFSISFPE